MRKDEALIAKDQSLPLFHHHQLPLSDPLLVCFEPVRWRRKLHTSEYVPQAYLERFRH